MTLTLILLATLMCGLVSVLLAASLSFTLLQRHVGLMVSFSVGALLTAAFLGMLPEAINFGMPAQQLGGWLLGGLLLFFILEKTLLWRHDHTSELKTTVPMVVIGDGLHNFVDGVAIAAAFQVDPALGFATALAILMHEIPQEIGDFMVLLAAGLSRRRALLLNALSGLAMVAGGLAGHWLLAASQATLPIVLALAAASFIYIAMADLIPHLKRQPTGIASGLRQTALIGAGGGAIFAGQSVLPFIR